jgi:hypothetical protein
MVDFAEIYSSKAEKYEQMVAREDYQNHIWLALNRIREIKTWM